MGTFFAIVLFSALSINVWGYLSVLLAPGAAVISVLQARRREPSMWWYYGVIGALYFMFLTLPWIYLTLRLSGRRIPIGVIVAGYTFTYLFWLISLLFTFLTLGNDVGNNFVLVSAASGVATTMVVSARFLVREARRIDERQWAGNLEPHYRVTLRNSAYVLPFILAISQLLLLEWSIRAANMKSGGVCLLFNLDVCF